MSSRAYLSIGEVLSLVQQEFPDVTISKIRFLESQGLLDPERTPSGYRKFYAGDVDRLRWILRQQRERFLPLKVIKDRLDSGAPLTDDLDLDANGTAEAAGGREAAANPAAPAAAEAEHAPERLPVWMTQRPPSAGPLPSATPRPARVGVAAPAGPAGTGPSAPAAERVAGGASGASPRVASGTRSGAGEAKGDAAERTPLPAGGLAGGASFTLEELATAASCEPADVRRLVEYGLVVGRSVGREVVFDEDALVVARLAGEFGRFGIEPRHLRLYRMQAEREAGLFEQVVLPLLKQRNPQARQRATETLGELGRLGDGMRRALLSQELRDHR